MGADLDYGCKDTQTLINLWLYERIKVWVAERLEKAS
jgi:hypothetical protein